jgi:hypothetical protein
MKLLRKKLDNNRERKLSLDYRIVEQITTEFLERWNIDSTVESWLSAELEKNIDWRQVTKNLTSGRRNYVPQFGEKLFLELQVKVQKSLDNDRQNEIVYLKKEVGSVEAQHFDEIFENVMNQIPLTMFEDGIQRVTLVSYHYLLKVVNRLAEQYMQANEIKNINGTKNPTELFITELYNIIANNKEMTRFTLTIKSLIEQWLGKYNAKTKISEFYYDVLMITPDVIVEKILKYMLFTAMRNKNPFVLRAIFSSYITLIHKNLFSFYATNLTKIKLGYFKQLEGLFTENFDLIFDQGKQSDPKKFIMNSLIFNYVIKNKRYMKNNFSLLSDEYTQNFLEPNYFDVFSSYRPALGMPFLDHLFFYTTNLKFTRNSILREGNYYKISSDFFKKNILKRNKMIIKDLLIKHLQEPFWIYFKDEETVDEIFESMAKDLVQKLNLDHYLDENFKQLGFTYDQYLLTIEKFIILMKKAIDGDGIRRAHFAQIKG